MTREEAVEEARRRRTQDGGAWLPQERDGAWRVVRVAAPGLREQRPGGAHVEGRPRPPQADDPRPAAWRDVPPWGAGGL